MVDKNLVTEGLQGTNFVPPLGAMGQCSLISAHGDFLEHHCCK